ncbi:phosphatase domain-containing protein [Bizionia sp. KMM 8389]
MPIVWQISTLHLTQNRTAVRGVILKKAPVSFTIQRGIVTNLIRVFRSYFNKAYANMPIILESNGHTYKVQTNASGGFEIILNHLHKGELHISLPNSDTKLKTVQNYPINFTESLSDVDVISDIDDTIIISNTASVIKRVTTLAFNAPQKRQVIPFTQNLLEAFRSRGANFYYVSKSESNLFNIITHFISFNKLPKGLLFLTPHLTLLRLFQNKKPPNFKQHYIKFIIENTKSKKYILLGDDTQKDMAIYTEIIKLYPHSILIIYIRKTSDKTDTTLQIQMKKALEASKTPVTYFNSNDHFDVQDALKHL